MRASRVIAGAALLLALAACGTAADQGATPAGGIPPSEPSTGTTTSPEPSTVVDPAEPKLPPYPTGVGPPGAVPKVPTGAVLLPASQVDLSGIPASYSDRSVYQFNVWSQNDGRTLIVQATAHDACRTLQARVADQTESAVKVNISARDAPQGGPPDAPSGGGMCAQVLSPQLLTVDLKVPLGSRKVFLSEAP